MTRSTNGRATFMKTECTVRATTRGETIALISDPHSTETCDGNLS